MELFFKANSWFLHHVTYILITMIIQMHLLITIRLVFFICLLVLYSRVLITLTIPYHTFHQPTITPHFPQKKSMFYLFFVLLMGWQYKNMESMSALFFNCMPQSEAASLSLTSPILPALHLAATTAYNAPTTLPFLPANRCHVTVNLHCTYVTFYKLRCPWSQVINIGQGNWMLIEETID